MTIANPSTQQVPVLTAEEKRVWELLEQVYDPEVPVISIVDLGVVRKVEVTGDETIITITPTYSGCPAMDVIAMNIRMHFMQHGIKNVVIKQALSPAWTTDWMTDKGKQNLKAYGIAPPVGKSFNKEWLEDLEIECPRCRSSNSRLLSEFGSTSCKALFQCNDCKEPFDYFKCH
jgi:ring-1,2-phenylacetyl-CoA epoxidase subunit PaaD